MQVLLSVMKIFHYRIMQPTAYAVVVDQTTVMAELQARNCLSSGPLHKSDGCKPTNLQDYVKSAATILHLASAFV